MRGRWTANLLLLVLVLVLGAAARQTLEHEARIGVLTDLDPAEVHEITLAAAAGPAIRLRRQGAGWWMEAPYTVAADGERIDRLLRVAQAPVRRALPEDTPRGPLGLDPPRARLTLDGRELTFGDTEPIAHRRYVATGGRIHLIDDGFHHHLTAAPEAFVDPHPLPAGLVPEGGTLDGVAIAPEHLAGLARVTARAVLPLGEVSAGRLLALRDASGSTLRFLVSADGREWTRLELRLRYELAEPPIPVPAEPAAPDAPRPDDPAGDPQGMPEDPGIPDWWSASPTPAPAAEPDTQAPEPAPSGTTWSW